MKKNAIYLLLVVLFMVSSFSLVHKFYVSVAQVEYNRDQESLQIILRVFIDDLEELLRQRYDQTIVLDQESKSTKDNKYIAAYLNQKINIEVNDQEKKFLFLGKEYEDDLLICYLEIENVPRLDSIVITNQILMDVFEEQQNIVHVKKGETRKSLILEKGKAMGVLNFSE